jgi:hypothetical protein
VTEVIGNREFVVFTPKFFKILFKEKKKIFGVGGWLNRSELRVKRVRGLEFGPR